MHNNIQIAAGCDVFNGTFNMSTWLCLLLVCCQHLACNLHRCARDSSM